MSLFRRARLAPAAALAACLAIVAGPASAQQFQALSASDRLSYTNAFDALRRGDLDEARAAARQANDRVLLGRVEFERLFHPDYAATFEELSAWLDDYADLPDAPRAWALAMRRRPDGAPEPRRPTGGPGGWRTNADSEAPASDPAKAARILYNADDLTGAYQTGVAIGDWWVAGLAAWRLGDFNPSFLAFRRVAEDPLEDAWVRAGAAVWAARAAERSGRLDQVIPYLRLATRWPSTFYGQIALARLGEEPLIENQGPQPYLATPGVRSAPFIPDTPMVERAALDEFVRTDPRARRAVAYQEVGRREDFEAEARLGLRGAQDEPSRALWTGLIQTVGYRGTPSDRAAERIDAFGYPLPDLQPEGGYVVEQSLVFAIVRKETNFNPDARSSVGAYGMMQVMPTTAAELSGDRDLIDHPRRLLQPALNLQLGQAYVMRMLALPQFNGDLLRTVASYNAGPGPMLAALRRLGPDPDPLLLIETIDVPQARDYVEKVVAAYWIYQRLMGRPLRTLEAVAAGATHIPVSLDALPLPQATALQVASAPGQPES